MGRPQVGIERDGSFQVGRRRLIVPPESSDLANLEVRLRVAGILLGRLLKRPRGPIPKLQVEVVATRLKEIIGIGGIQVDSLVVGPLSLSVLPCSAIDVP